MNNYIPAREFWRQWPLGSDLRRRLERDGWHPKRIQIGPRAAVYRAEEVRAYLASPDEWAKRNRAAHFADPVGEQ